MRAIVLVIAALALSGCAEFAGCPSGLNATWHAELFFGRNIGSQLGVSDADWQSFVAGEIAPRFPAGFTVADASGVWRAGDGSAVHEPSKVVTIFAPAATETRGRLDAIASAYKVRFHQEAVGIVVEPTCAAF